jgi:hypothetical protein
MTTSATQAVFGVVEVKPLKGFPPGKVRIRMRHNDFVVVFIRPPNGGVRRFVIEERAGHWVPAHEIGANVIP